MDQHETTTPTERKPLGRRTVLKGAAWSVPAVVAVGATPAFAATGATFTFDELPQTIYSENAASVLVSGSVPAGATVTISYGSTTLGAFTDANNDGQWAGTIDVSNINVVPDGTNLSFTALEGTATFPSITNTVAIKDTVAPIITYNTPTVAANGKSGSTVGQMGTLTAPASASTDDIRVVTYDNFDPGGTTGTVAPALTQDAATGVWTFSWSYTGTSNAKGRTMSVDILQSDGAGNQRRETITWTT